MSAPSSEPSRSLAPTPQRSGPRRDHLLRHKARFLDPSAAVRFEQQKLETTAYVEDQLLLRARPNQGRVIEVLTKAAHDRGYDLSVDKVDDELVELAEQAKIPLDDEHPLVVRVHLHRRYDGAPQPAADAWPVLQSFRQLIGEHDPHRTDVQLEHLLTTAAGIRPAPYVAHAAGLNPYVAHPYVAHPYVAHPYVAHPYVAHANAEASAEYAQPGWGGRMPVVWVGPRPTRRSDDELGGARRPVVAVLDTGVGTHPWLDGSVVDREPTCAHLRIGLTDPHTDIERTGVVTGELTGSLDVEAGHGTFIAGLVHQRCPDARILSVRVVQPDGVVSEYDVLQAVTMLWLRQELAIRQGTPERLIDVVSLSLGYYHEQRSDAWFDALMLAPLRALGRLGVAVVTSAGNDATNRPLYPAAFAPHAAGLITKVQPHEMPVVAVGATNPDGSIALFSNDGPWVRAYRPGAGLVSTMPTTFDAGAKATVQVLDRQGHVRSTIDPDSYLSGFGTWSGTSFSAPVLAGDIAACLNEAEVLRTEPTTSDDRVAATMAALHVAVPQL